MVRIREASSGDQRRIDSSDPTGNTLGKVIYMFT